MEVSRTGAICALAFVALAALVMPASGLKCHQCTSFKSTQCGDPFHYEATRVGEEKRPKTMEFLEDCPTDKNYTICRKIYQNVRGDVRIIRSCGFEEYKSDCYKTVLEEYNTYVCQCKGDGCNAANPVSASSAVAVAVAAVVAYAAVL